VLGLTPKLEGEVTANMSSYNTRDLKRGISTIQKGARLGTQVGDRQGGQQTGSEQLITSLPRKDKGAIKVVKVKTDKDFTKDAQQWSAVKEHIDPRAHKARQQSPCGHPQKELLEREPDQCCSPHGGSHTETTVAIDLSTNRDGVRSITDPFDRVEREADLRDLAVTGLEDSKVAASPKARSQGGTNCINKLSAGVVINVNHFIERAPRKGGTIDTQLTSTARANPAAQQTDMSSLTNFHSITVTLSKSFEGSYNTATFELGPVGRKGLTIFAIENKANDIPQSPFFGHRKTGVIVFHVISTKTKQTIARDKNAAEHIALAQKLGASVKLTGAAVADGGVENEAVFTFIFVNRKEAVKLQRHKPAFSQPELKIK
jgi:hypothetical protein